LAPYDNPYDKRLGRMTDPADEWEMRDLPDEPEINRQALRYATYLAFGSTAEEELEELVMELAVQPARLSRDDPAAFEDAFAIAKLAVFRCRELLNQMTEAEAMTTIARLELTRLLLERGWTWDDIDQSVWSYLEPVRDAARREGSNEPSD
jgi:hypothetical protein